ncbi:hypothetical protein JCM3766R1_006312 [Sporobolomyces carnicolor]
MRPEIQHALAKTLVNRRIYWLLRPVWLQEIRYTINHAQLDERLCGLVDGTIKQSDIRRLDIVLDETHVHLFALALARLPRLTDLRLFLTESESDSNYKVLLTALERHLTAGHRFDELEIESGLAVTDSVVEECFRAFHDKVGRFRSIASTQADRQIENLGGFKHATVYAFQAGDYGDLSWTDVRSLRLRERSNEDGAAKRIISFLTQGFVVRRGAYIASSIRSLRQLEINLNCWAYGGQEAAAVFDAAGFTLFLRLICKTKLERLRFVRVIKAFPPISGSFAISNVRVLEISGVSSTSETSALESHLSGILSLLKVFPLLEHFEISGDRLFQPDPRIRSGSDDGNFDTGMPDVSDIIRLDTADLCSLQPCLASILLFLTESSAVQTFEISCGRRSVRWMRASKEDRFEREGYTS